MNILLASKNPGKIDGVTQAFNEYFKDVQVTGYSVSSGVSEEPVNEEIYKGALNRVNNLISLAKENNLSADYYCGVESGITNLLGKWIIISVAVIKDNSGYESWGTSQGFPVPEKLVDKIIKTDLSVVMSDIFKQTNLRSGKGGINILTHNKVTRIELTKQAFLMALIQFINNDIWRN